MKKRNELIAGVLNIAVGLVAAIVVDSKIKTNVKNKYLKYILRGVLIPIVETIYVSAGVECLNRAFKDEESIEESIE